MKKLTMLYDGKRGRGVEADILFDLFIVTKIRLKEWGEPCGEYHTMWIWRRLIQCSFPICWKRPWTSFRKGRGGWLKTRNSIMRMMFRLPGDWYSAAKK